MKVMEKLDTYVSQLSISRNQQSGEVGESGDFFEVNLRNFREIYDLSFLCQDKF